ncbi:MAG: protein tyrosine phosphatase [Deltaproteobacteria bacterium]|nr:protein tyrosine phosphatase [Deltaproteobacteria bacterium]
MPAIRSCRAFFTLLLFLFLCGGCARRPSAPPTRTWPQPCDNCIVGVENFTKVSAALWRGAQPTAEGFRKLEAAGAKTILWPLLKSTQLKYLSIPSDAWDPEQAQLVLFLKILNDPKNWPVFVHCAEGRDRTGYSVATYRMVIENWSVDDALHEMFDFRFNAIWFRNPTFLRKLNVAQMRERVLRAP